MPDADPVVIAREPAAAFPEPAGRSLGVEVVRSRARQAEVSHAAKVNSQINRERMASPPQPDPNARPAFPAPAGSASTDPTVRVPSAPSPATQE